ncbi:MAG: hypothetical protein UY56_C0006G0027, partial [Parcubacteria group bacterium GW2011_GWA1_50_14]
MFLIISTVLVSLAPYIETKTQVNEGLPGGGVILSPEGKRSFVPNFSLPTLVKDVHAKDDTQSDINTSFELATKGLRLTGETKDFKALETPSFVVYQEETIFERISGTFKKSSSKDEIRVRVFNAQGEVFKDIFVSEEEENKLKIKLEGSLKPGEYSLVVQDDKGHGLIQDFTWGVLAINTNKSIYLPGEEAKFSMAV